MQNYDIVIIGSGPGGYVAAIRAAQLGASVCVIEKDKLGGTCLNRGCIPTKTLYASTELLSQIKKAKEFGIKIDGNSSPDFSAMLSRVENVVGKLRNGIQFLFNKRNIKFIQAEAKILSADTVLAGGDKLKAKSVIIATGSSPIQIPGFEFNPEQSRGIEFNPEQGRRVEFPTILSSDDILGLKEVPNNLLIIGAGVIGCEWADIFSGLGTKVTMVEMMDQILPATDKEIAKKLEINLKNKGINIFTKTRAEKQEKDGGIVKTSLSNGETIETEKVLVCVGRKPNISGLGLEDIGIKHGKNGISVDKYLRTNIKNIFAVGDCIGGYLLAHVASYEGILAVENALGQNRSVDYKVVPNCIFVQPPIACVGKTADEAKKEGIDIEIGKFPYTASGKAQAMGQTEGFVKIIADKNSKNILGAQIFGIGATEIIQEIALAIKLGANARDIVETIHAHPTLPETIMEAAEGIYKHAIHTL